MELYRTSVTVDHENTLSSCYTQATRCRRFFYMFTEMTLRLVVLMSVLRPAITDMSYAGVRQQYSDVASRTIQADLVIEGRVERVVARRTIVMRVLTVFKDRRLRRWATSVNSSRPLIAVDDASLADSVEVVNVTPRHHGEHLVVFLRHRHDGAALTYYVTSGGRRRRRKVNLYRMFALPADANEVTRQIAEEYSKRRNSE